MSASNRFGQSKQREMRRPAESELQPLKATTHLRVSSAVKLVGNRDRELTAYRWSELPGGAHPVRREVRQQRRPFRGHAHDLALLYLDSELNITRDFQNLGSSRISGYGMPDRHSVERDPDNHQWLEFRCRRSRRDRQQGSDRDDRDQISSKIF
jgi:hypothetical protein